MAINSRPNCKVCFGPRRDEINDLIARGTAMLAIENEMRATGFVIKREAVGKHVQVCLNGDVRNLTSPKDVMDAEQRLISGMSADEQADFAILVHQKAVEELRAGRLRVGTRDGLSARALLDRREEKAEERSFMLNLARLLSGGGNPTPEALTDGTIEGTFKDVTPSGENPNLAPAELRAP